MSTHSPVRSNRGFLAAILLIALVLWAMPSAFAGDGHIGSKPPNADGDGIPNQSDPDFAYGSRNGEQNFNGDSPHGTDPAHDGGDGIPNGGPVEGENQIGNGTVPDHDGGDGIPNGGPIEGQRHTGKGGFELFTLYLSLLFGR